MGSARYHFSGIAGAGMNPLALVMRPRGHAGKSTITGMLAWILRSAGVDATVIGGAGLVGDGSGGCFAAGSAEGPVIAEACESDGTLVGYRPAIGLVHNISRDHGEVDALRRQ